MTLESVTTMQTRFFDVRVHRTASLPLPTDDGEDLRKHVGDRYFVAKPTGLAIELLGFPRVTLVEVTDISTKRGVILQP